VINKICEGKRIIELRILGQNLKYCQCRNVFSLERIVRQG